MGKSYWQGSDAERHLQGTKGPPFYGERLWSQAERVVPASLPGAESTVVDGWVS
jgi:hypothetical protein